MVSSRVDAVVFFFNDTATTEIYTLSLHDALPILANANRPRRAHDVGRGQTRHFGRHQVHGAVVLVCLVMRDRKSTRLNSSHITISYAVFCLKKKNTTTTKPATYVITHTSRDVFLC